MFSLFRRVLSFLSLPTSNFSDLFLSLPSPSIASLAILIPLDAATISMKRNPIQSHSLACCSTVEEGGEKSRPERKSGGEEYGREKFWRIELEGPAATNGRRRGLSSGDFPA
jgi:hypothetical protein